MQKLLLFVDKVSTWVGQAFSWLIVALTLLITWEVFSRYVLDAPARVGVRRDDHDVRHAVHDGGRLHAGEERPRARRRAVRLLPAAHCRRRSTSSCTSCSSSPASSRSPGPATSTPPSRGRSTSTRTSPPTARRSIPFKTVIPIAGAFLLLQGIVEIIRCVICLQAGRLAVARGGRRGSRRRQAEGDGAREGRGHREARLARRAAGRRRANEEGSLVRPVDHGGGRDRDLRADAARPRR